MKEWLYVNQRNGKKYLAVKRYNDGHYVWQQFIQGVGEKPVYVGCNLRQNRRGGVWHRVGKKTMVEVLADYRLVVAV